MTSVELTLKERFLIKAIAWARRKLPFDPETGRVIYLRAAGMFRGNVAEKGVIAAYYTNEIADDRRVFELHMTPESFGGAVRHLNEAQQHLWGFAGTDAGEDSRRTTEGVEVVAIINTSKARFRSKATVSEDEIKMWEMTRDPLAPHPVSLKLITVHTRLAQRVMNSPSILDDDEDEWVEEEE